jgi:hypothetical protein
LKQGINNSDEIRVTVSGDNLLWLDMPIWNQNLELGGTFEDEQEALLGCEEDKRGGVLCQEEERRNLLAQRHSKHQFPDDALFFRRPERRPTGTRYSR